MIHSGNISPFKVKLKTLLYVKKIFLGPPDKVALAQKLIQERVGGPPPPGASFAASPQQPTPPHGMMAPPTRPAYNPQAPPPVNFGQSAPPPASPMVPPVMPTPPPVYGG